MSLTSKDPNKFIGDLVLYCACYLKIKKVSLNVQELVYSLNFWYLGKFFDFIRGLGILYMRKSGKNI